MPRLTPYLSFRDNAREALEFYRSVLGGTVEISTFEEFNASDDPTDAGKVMHGHLRTPGGLELMASDTPTSMDLTPGDTVSLSLSGAHDEADTMRGYWHRLCDGGKVVMPLELAPWGDYFGMCTDRFGMHWMIDYASAEAMSDAAEPQGAQA